MSMNLTPGRYKRRKEPSHIAYYNMLGAGLMMQKLEDDMEQHLHDQMIRIQHALKLKEKQEKRGKVGNG